MSKGLLIVYTGNGKGKTTAALGLAFRALGHGFRVSFIQFIKGSWNYGEMESARLFDSMMDFHVLGKGFTWKSLDIDEDTAMACQAWEFAKGQIASGRFQVVVLDELTYLMKYGMVEEAEVVRALADRPDGLHVVVTGRDAPASLIETADLVTEMKDIKHPYTKGIKAQKGIEF
ncbi:MAG TPA: cob(I)yrinic acid a,c-diamide adenosyltransferase [Thermodesulfovibrionia bacterium]|nr:cob(I)yrinic acid a,c-diamide adenosyltransferase [Thermodesulfovibrionia bacterium]